MQIFLAIVALLNVHWLIIVLFPNTRAGRALSLPVRAIVTSRRAHVSLMYAQDMHHAVDLWEMGKMSQPEFLREIERLAEKYPKDDFKMRFLTRQ